MEFTSQELARLRVAPGVDPLWETALSLHLLQNRQAPLAFGAWRREVGTALRQSGLVSVTRALTRLCPDGSYFPDFLTPGRGDADLESGLDRLLSTPRHRLRAELTRLHAHTGHPAPAGLRPLADGCPKALHRLGAALRAYHQVAVDPYLASMRAQAAADRTIRVQAVLTHGAEGLLTGYDQLPGWRYQDRNLHAPYPIERELTLHGRALTLIPAFFCVRAPLALVDEELPPVLVHPLSPAPGWLERRHRGRDAPVAQLIGASRAELLRVLDRPMTTMDIAAALRLAPSTASRHATVLREAGLLLSQRQGVRVLHHRTGLGRAVLDGAPTPQGGSAEPVASAGSAEPPTP